MFVSSETLKRRKTLPRALGAWALDSGGFTVLQRYGTYPFSAEDYVREVYRYRDEIGNLALAPCMDWMCEPIVIAGGQVGGMTFVGTKLSVATHQQNTVANYLRLQQLAPDLPWIPVLQGYTRDDYMRCVDAYDFEWVDLTKEPVVGLGSICRRQNTTDAERIICELHSMGIRLHAFGFKIGGLERCAHMLESADSMAWSLDARLSPPLEGCTHGSCANCIRYAMTWRQKVLGIIAKPKQWSMAL